MIYYFRMTPDHRLLLGRGANYSYRFPGNIAGYVRKHIVRLFRNSRACDSTCLGRYVAITPNRMPYVGELEPGLINASGYSGRV